VGLFRRSHAFPTFCVAAVHVAEHSWRRWQRGTPSSDNRNTSTCSSCEPPRAGPRCPSLCDMAHRAAASSWPRPPGRARPSTVTNRSRTASLWGRCGRRQDPRPPHNGRSNRQASRSALRAAAAYRPCCSCADTRPVSGGFDPPVSCQCWPVFVRHRGTRMSPAHRWVRSSTWNRSSCRARSGSTVLRRYSPGQRDR
jgi:hypothetical protein